MGFGDFLSTAVNTIFPGLGDTAAGWANDPSSAIPVAATIIGGATGGPTGAMIGSSVGGGLADPAAAGTPWWQSLLTAAVPAALSGGGLIGASNINQQASKDQLDFLREKFNYEKTVNDPFLRKLQLAQLKQQADQAAALAAIQKQRILQDAYQGLMSATLTGGQMNSGALTNMASLGQAPLLRR